MSRAASTLSAPPAAWRDLPGQLLTTQVVATLAIAVGLSWLTWLAAPRPPVNSSVEAGFARDMSTHHAQAVAMALSVRDLTGDAEIRTIATDVILTQQSQIGQMRGWLDAWGDDANSVAPPLAWLGRDASASMPGMDMGQAIDSLMPGMATPDDVAQLAQAPPAALDEQFLRLMIRHHRGGVAIAQAALDTSDNGTVRRLASSIVTAQQVEITAMQNILTRKGLPTEPGDIPVMAMNAEHTGGFFASVPDAARSSLRLLPLVLAVGAAAWLAANALGGAATTLDGHAENDADPLWQALAVAGLLLSAALHIGFTPEHYREVPGYGVFFAVSGVASAALAGVLLARPRPDIAAFGGALSLALITIYILFRLTPPPGSANAEGFDAVGLLTKVAEVAALAGCLMLWRARTAPSVPEAT
jgi:uncharacterized protein (DUF305 family)